MGEMYFLTGNN